MEAEEQLTPPDAALVEIAETCPLLNPQQRVYVFWRVMGDTPIQSARKAGYSEHSWRVVEGHPHVREAIATMAEKLTPEHRVTSKTIVSILMEAIDLSRQKGQARNMIEGAKVLSDVLGLTAAQKISIQQQGQLDVTHHHQVNLLQQLDKNQLEQLLGLKRVLSLPEPIEGQYTEIQNY